MIKANLTINAVDALSYQISRCLMGFNSRIAIRGEIAYN